MMQKLCLLSDLHGFLPEELSEWCDLTIIAGDVCPLKNHRRPYQREWLVRTFLPWVRSLPTAEVVMVWGNHDFAGDQILDDEFRGVTILRNSSAVIGGLWIWGSPYSLRYGDWAFMCNESTLKQHYQSVPRNVDILVSHGPPHKAGDRVLRGEDVGSESLRACIEEKRPQLVVCGHIHEARGEYQIGSTRVLNVSTIDETYTTLREPVYVELEPRCAPS